MRNLLQEILEHEQDRIGSVQNVKWRILTGTCKSEIYNYLKVVKNLPSKITKKCYYIVRQSSQQTKARSPNMHRLFNIVLLYSTS